MSRDKVQRDVVVTGKIKSAGEDLTVKNESICWSSGQFNIEENDSGKQDE